jgi:D-xylose transport system substrate-binding protein
MDSLQDERWRWDRDQALTEAGLAGKVIVSGQDADLAACQRVVAGTQTMTVYKPIWLLAKRAADAALLLARKQPLGEKTQPVHNGRKDVPSILLKPTAVSRQPRLHRGPRRLP